MADHKTSLLMVEDDKFVALAYKDAFSREGFLVLNAYDGVEAIDKIRSENPDIVILDMLLPLKNGFEVLSDLKLDKKTENVPVIVLTNLNQPSDKKKCMDLGARDFLIKSDFTLKEVVSRVKEVVAFLGSK